MNGQETSVGVTDDRQFVKQGCSCVPAYQVLELFSNGRSSITPKDNSSFMFNDLKERTLKKRRSHGIIISRTELKMVKDWTGLLFWRAEHETLFSFLTRQYE